MRLVTVEYQQSVARGSGGAPCHNSKASGASARAIGDQYAAPITLPSTPATKLVALPLIA